MGGQKKTLKKASQPEKSSPFGAEKRARGWTAFFAEK